MYALSRSKHNRPLSGSHYHKRSMPLHPRVPTSMDLDLAVQRENHPVLREEEEREEYDYDDNFMLPHLPAAVPEKEEEEDEPVETMTPEESGEDITESEDDDAFAKSSQ